MRYRLLAALVLTLSLFAAIGGGVASAETVDGCIVTYDGHKEWHDSDKVWHDSDKVWYDSDKEWHRGYIAEDLCMAADEAPEPEIYPTAWWFFARMR